MTTSGDSNATEVEDDLAHFFGATEFNDRGSYFEDTNKRWDTHGLQGQQPTIENRLRVLDKIIKELDRVQRIRSMIAEESSENHLVTCLEKSRKAWKDCEEYKAGIEGGLVNQWSKRQRLDVNPDPEFLKALRRTLQKATQGQNSFDQGLRPPPSGHSRQLPEWFQRRRASTQVLRSQKSLAHLATTNEANKIAYDADEDFNAYLIQYRKSTGENFEPSDVVSRMPNRSISGSFPDQRILIRDLLGEIEIQQPDESQHRATIEHGKKISLPVGNLLKDPDPAANKIRYFHFPANNMAVSRYIQYLLILWKP